jgi:hypothetical protein
MLFARCRQPPRWCAPTGSQLDGVEWQPASLRRSRALRLQPILRRDARVASRPERPRVVDDVARVLVADEEAADGEMNNRPASARRPAGGWYESRVRCVPPAFRRLDLFGPQVPGTKGIWRVCQFLASAAYRSDRASGPKRRKAPGQRCHCWQHLGNLESVSTRNGVVATFIRRSHACVDLQPAHPFAASCSPRAVGTCGPSGSTPGTDTAMDWNT